MAGGYAELADPFCATVLKRVGLSTLAPNVDYSVQATQEARAAEDELVELRRRAMSQAARCFGQLDVCAAEARAEEERQLLSEKVERELEAFREEVRRKEAQEEERLSHVYRAMLGQPASGHAPSYTLRENTPGGHAAHHYQADGGRAFPPLIASAVRLQDGPEPRPAHRGSSSYQQAPVYSSGWGDRPFSWPSAVPPPAPPMLRMRTPTAAADYRRYTPSADYRQPTVDYRQPTVDYRQPRRRAPAQADYGHGAYASNSGEAHRMLQANLARLERLERLGL